MDLAFHSTAQAHTHILNWLGSHTRTTKQQREREKGSEKSTLNGFVYTAVVLVFDFWLDNKSTERVSFAETLLSTTRTEFITAAKCKRATTTIHFVLSIDI